MTRRLVLVLLCLVPVVLNAQMAIWSESGMVKVRPSDSPKENAAVYLSAARNEVEPFQLVVRALGRDVRGVDVDITDFLSTRGKRLSCQDNCTIYKELYLTAQTASGPYGQVGEWPDPLIPKVDRYAGERRNAFPLTVSKNRNQPIWIDVSVPASAAPGEYTAYVSVRAEGQRTVRMPVYLTVWNFQLPSTSTIKNAFLLWGGALRYGHGQNLTRDDVDKLVLTYSKAMLAHRISNGWLLSAQDWQPAALEQPEADAKAQLQRALGPFFNGTVLPNGAKITAAVPGTEACLGGVNASETGRDAPIAFAGTLCQPNMIAALSTTGWLQKTAFYLPDEPNLADGNVVNHIQELAQSIHARNPALRTFLTSAYSSTVEAATDTWVLPLRDLDKSVKNGSYWSTYSTEKLRGKQIWVYQSCLSHICGVQSLFPGLPEWPDYMIDMQGMSNRVQDWINWKYGVDGELYWGVNYNYYWQDTYRDQFAAGGNGDGDFFYPGRPDVIGGKSDIPVESIRLKLKREGLEDYEYLTILASLGEKNFADAEAVQIVRSATEWEHDANVLYRVRAEIATQIQNRMRELTVLPTRPNLQ